MSDNYEGHGLRNNPDLTAPVGYVWVGYTLMTYPEVNAEGWHLVGEEWRPGTLEQLRSASRTLAEARRMRGVKP